MTSRRRHRSSTLSILLAFSVLGSLASAGAAAGSGNRGGHGVGGHGHGGHVSHGHGGHVSHGHGGHGRGGHVSRGHHGPSSSRGVFHGGFHQGLRGYGVRYVAGPFGSYRNFSVTGGYRSYGGFSYRTYPTYRFYPYRGSAYPYPVSYAPVADPSVYATPGSVYDPVYQHGVAAQPLDGYYGDAYYDDGYYEDEAEPQPIYIIVQPAGAGSQQPVQTPQQQPVAQARPYHPLAVSGGEAGQVFLSVHPSNAAVYLDDDLLGSGDSLSESRAPFVLDSGVHVLEVIHPQYPPQRLVFGMPSEGRLLIEFDLEGDRRGRKAKVTELGE